MAPLHARATPEPSPLATQPVSPALPTMQRLPSVDQEVQSPAVAAVDNKLRTNASEAIAAAATAPIARLENAVASSIDPAASAVKPAVAIEEKAGPSSKESPAKESPSPSDARPAYQGGDWLKSRDHAIAALEEEIRLAQSDAARSAEATQLETLLRLHLALAGRRDEAAKAVAGLREPEQEFWRHEALALVDLLGPDRLPSESRRFAVALKSLEEAESHLAAAGSLTLHHLALCRKVQDFGVFEKFTRGDFAPNQEVLLYVEVRNFMAEETSDRYETELQGSFRVLDRSGVARAERTLPLDKQTCASRRRDYYIAYRLYIPSELPPGAYTLELTIEDKKGNKSNNALLDFNVVQ